MRESQMRSYLIVSNKKAYISGWLASGYSVLKCIYGCQYILISKGLAGNLTDVTFIQLPAEVFNYDGVQENLIKWISLWDDISCSFDNNGVSEIFVEDGSKLCSFSVLIKRIRQIGFSIIFFDSPAKVRTFELHLYGLARCFVLFRKDISALLRSSYIASFEAFDSIHCAIASLDKKSKSFGDVGVTSQIGPSSIKLEGDKTRVLIVSHFAGECRGCAVQRVNYFFEELGKLMTEAEVHLVAAVGCTHDPRSNVHVVQDFGPSALISEDGTYVNWSSKSYLNEKVDAQSFSTLGYYWRFCLEEYFSNIDAEFDIVIISGNPFHVFQFSRYAKQKWYAKTVLDYRDPFANNPRILCSEENREKARYAEYGYNFSSDLLLSVNEHCVNSIVSSRAIPRLVVENGYDERVVSGVLTGFVRKKFSDGRVNFVHAGSLYYYSKPLNFVRAISDQNAFLIHLGGKGYLCDEVLSEPKFEYIGRKSYPDAIRCVADADCGVVFLSETNFETSTKIFDYLAVGIDVLLCTDGALNTGTLAEMLEGVDGVYWCHNTEADIRGFVSSYIYNDRKSERVESRKKFSRRASLEKLAEGIESLMS